MTVTLIMWGHALAALMFGMLALSQFRGATNGLPRLAFLVSLGATACWALAVAGIGTHDVATRLVEAVRNLGWLAFMLALIRGGRSALHTRAVSLVYGVVVVIVLAGGVLAIVETAYAKTSSVAVIADIGAALGMMVAVSAMVLVHHLYLAVAPHARGGIRIVVVALAAMWTIDLAHYATTYLASEGTLGLSVLRGAAMAVIAPVFGLAVHRNGDWTLQLSRAVAYRSLSVAAVGLYLIAVALIASLIGMIGLSDPRLAQTALVFGATAALATIISTPQLRVWAKVKLAKHLFSHRYDYRVEWLRFTDTLGKPGDGATLLEERMVKAVADLTDSPAALLLVPDGAGMELGSAWNWVDRDTVVTGDAAMLARHLEATQRIIEIDAVRQSVAEPADMAATPHWVTELADAWVIVPLIHFGKLVGAVLLARPPVDRRPDWEDFDLLRVAGRQAASYLAEARAHDALSEAQRFDEFNRRFAFIMHDIKNLVSQLSLVARNAERHADNPEFRVDMVATLQDSAARMNDLLARLSQHHSGRADVICAVEIAPIAERVSLRHRGQHPVLVSGIADAVAHADPARVEQVIGHLVQNAIDASPAGEPVMIAVSRIDSRIAIDVIDHGTGMSPAFVRDRLFKPFVSSKTGGFGLGAFEARQLAEAMGGAVEVFSREAEGSRFRVTLPVAPALQIGQAA